MNEKNPFLILKKQRLLYMEGLIKSLGETKKSTFLALVQYHTGISLKLAQQYTQILVNANRIVTNGPIIRFNNVIKERKNEETPSHTHTHT